jgi:hypothetical protein
VSTFDFGLSKQIDTFGGKKNLTPDPDQCLRENANKISGFSVATTTLAQD